MTKLEQELLESFYVHFPLQADEDKTIESRALDKTLTHSIDLWQGQGLEGWSFEGDGEASITPEGGLKLTTWPRAEKWPESEMRADDATTGQYATFGSYIARLDVSGLDMSRGNRIRFDLYSNCPGLHSPIVRVAFVNNGAIKIPDIYSREGFHAMNLKNHSWNAMSWEIDSIAHDKLEEISFIMHRYGKEISTGDLLEYEIRNIRFEEVERPEVVHGWQCQEETAVFSTTGYWAGGAKTAIANTQQASFSIVDAETGTTIYNGPIQRVKTYHGVFGLLDFTSVKQAGNYQICFGGYISDSFAIGEKILESAVWKLINFLFCERCGFPVPNKHGTCHLDVTAEYKGVKMCYAGGWHDAADVSQQTMQSAEIVHALLETAVAVKAHNLLLHKRLLEEANWGLDYVLRTRYGDGWRATNSAIRRWTDNLLGNMDDSFANGHNHSFENFIFAAVEAYSAACFADTDPELAWKCSQVAQEDFDFALERFREVGLEEKVLHEHAGTASLSQYYAAACWGAAQLYAVTQKDMYVPLVAEFAAKIIACQETSKKTAGLQGYFYRDETHSHIVHFNHQARNQIFVQALEAACTHLPAHSDKAAWEQSMALFGEYLKSLQKYTLPYGMLPAGLHHIEEAEDGVTFARMHPNVEHQWEKGNYRAQLENGIKLDDGYYIRCFPVWFSFRGNSAIHLSMGKAATLLGKYFGDNTLQEIGREQLYWTLGKNPMGQSLLYGEGSNYGQQYTALLGETVGEMPVGVQTRANEDLPYWPPANIATYREVWTTPPARWLWIAADLAGQGL